MFADGGYATQDGIPLDPKDYSTEQMREMVQDQVDEDGYESWDEGLIDIHHDSQGSWLDMVCQCKKTPPHTPPVDIRFSQLVKVGV